jgi:hypothetical protein
MADSITSAPTGGCYSFGFGPVPGAIDVTGVSDVSVKQAEAQYSLTSGGSGITIANWFSAYGIPIGPGGIATFSARNTPGFKGDGATNPNVQASLDYLSQYRPAADMIDLLRTSGNVTVNIISNPGDEEYRTPTGSSTINWNPNCAYVVPGQGLLSPALALDHELGHSVGDLFNPTLTDTLGRTPFGDYTNLEEYRDITQVENPAAAYFGQPIRTDHLYHGSVNVAGPIPPGG